MQIQKIINYYEQRSEIEAVLDDEVGYIMSVKEKIDKISILQKDGTTITVGDFDAEYSYNHDLRETLVWAERFLTEYGLYFSDPDFVKSKIPIMYRDVLIDQSLHLEIAKRSYLADKMLYDPENLVLSIRDLNFLLKIGTYKHVCDAAITSYILSENAGIKVEPQIAGRTFQLNDFINQIPF